MHKIALVENDQCLELIILQKSPQDDQWEILRQKLTPWTEIPSVQLLLYYSDAIGEHKLQMIAEEQKYCPTIPIASLQNQTVPDYANPDQWHQLFQKQTQRWCMLSNLKYIEESFKVGQYMRLLWESDRYQFFEELWYWLKTHLDPSELTIFFHDIKDAIKDKIPLDGKAQLGLAVVKGEKIPFITNTSDAEEQLLNAYREEMDQHFRLHTYDPHTGEWVASIKIGHGPILILAKIPHFQPLQQAVILSLFNSFNT